MEYRHQTYRLHDPQLFGVTHRVSFLELLTEDGVLAWQVERKRREVVPESQSSQSGSSPAAVIGITARLPRASVPSQVPSCAS